ncbi:auxin efflux carrier [Aspergillus pseudodeflectus]|uniref:Auxin efflux carrier n=1 Tax=Aspergillus pseudodeflectus TaxID=176178 RepID=A0ABR4JMT9_9EURO
MPQGSLRTSFVGALQACVSVVLTLGYGVLTRHFGLIQTSSIHDVSGLGVKVFLPALILVHLGEQLKLDNAMNYLPVLVWAIVYTSFSILLGHLASKLLKLPRWVIPACAFNNTTSLPLLLLQSLESVGSLKMIVQDGDSVTNAIARAQSYFLLCGVISKTIGYAVGPTMLTHADEDGEDDDHDQERDHDAEGNAADTEAQNGHAEANEEMPLLRGRSNKANEDLSTKLKRWAKKVVFVFPKRIKQNVLTAFDTPLADVAIICTLVGAVLGLVPQLHKAFFNSYEEGGIFNAWLTSSIKNTGKLFTTLQIFIVGCELGVSFEKIQGGSREGGRDSNPGWKAILTIFLVRLVIWPALSIAIIYGLAKNTSVLRSDPVLWFSMMLMPAGPPALVIQGLAELAKVSETQKMTIAKTLTIMYMLSPCISFTITGALEASKAALQSN